MIDEKNKLQVWLNAIAAYRDPKVVGILCLSFSSGLPFLLTLGTLHAWLKEQGVSNTGIGLFSLTTLPYAFKFLWAPVIDLIPIPKLTDLLGKRRSWILVSQMALLLSLMGLGLTNPAQHIGLTAFMAFMVCLCSATQDNGIEAYRVEVLNLEKPGPASAASIIGFRVGMWISGGGALYLAAHLPWRWVYIIMSSFIIVGMITTLLVEEPESSSPILEPWSGLKNKTMRLQHIYSSIMKPAFMSLLRYKTLYMVLPFIFLFKVGDTVLNMMSIPFLLEIGFEKAEIAHVAKTFGLCALIIGGFIGGLLLQRYTMIQNITLSLCLLITSCFVFVLQAKVGHDIGFLFITIGIENIACGMSAATLITFLSRLCLPPFCATHFAFFSSFSSLSRVGLSTVSGWLADHLSWEAFFIYVAAGCLPTLFLVWVQKEVFGFVKSSTPRELYKS